MTTPTSWSSPERPEPPDGDPATPSADPAAGASAVEPSVEPAVEPSVEPAVEPSVEPAGAAGSATLGIEVEELEVLEVEVVGIEPAVVPPDAVPAGGQDPGQVPGQVAEPAPEPAPEPEPAGPVLGPTGREVVAFLEPPPLDRHGPAHVIAVCNQKGGVGKTTSTINLGAALAGYGRRVLLLDFDPQGALSAGLGVNPNALDSTVYDLLMNPREVAAADVVIATDVPGMDLLPANIDLSAAEVALVNEVAREQSLARAIAPLLPDYDYVLIDCQPSLGLLTVNALAAADGVVIPLECEYFALRGMKLLVETIHKVQDRINPRLQIDGILATMYDARTVHRRQVLERVVEAFGDTVFHTVIATTVKFPETTVAGTPITEYAPSSAGAVAYRALAREVVARQPGRG